MKKKLKLKNQKMNLRRLRRVATRMEQTSGETDTGVDDIEVDDDAEDMGGQPSEAKKRRTEVRSHP